MAEEEQFDVDAMASKGSPMVKIIAGVLLLAVLAGGGYYAYITFFQEPEVSEAASPEEEKSEEGETKVDKNEETSTESEGGGRPPRPVLGVLFSMEPFIVNLAQTDGKRFLKVSITLELSAAEVNPEVNENLQKIKDSILILLSSKTFEDVYSVQGKFKLKDEITTRVNRFLVLGHVKDAYFTEFVIQ